MGLGQDEVPFPDNEPDEDETEEIRIDVTDERTVLVSGSDWEIELQPEEARLLADALRDAANDAESDEEEAENSPMDP